MDFIKQSYMTQRKAIGILGMLLPFLLVLGSWSRGFVELGSALSNYYYSFSRDIFVGSLAAIGVFLIYYTGHRNDRKDSWITTAAGILMVCVALFPCRSDGNNFDLIPCFDKRATDIFQFLPRTWTGNIHNISAIGTFVLLGAMSFFQFTQYGKEGSKNSRENMPAEVKNIKQKLNLFYRICGVLIWFLLALMLILHFAGIKNIIWPESLILWLFGISWTIKGWDYKKRYKTEQ